MDKKVGQKCKTSIFFINFKFYQRPEFEIDISMLLPCHCRRSSNTKEEEKEEGYRRGMLIFLIPNLAVSSLEITYFILKVPKI